MSAVSYALMKSDNTIINSVVVENGDVETLNLSLIHI